MSFEDRNEVKIWIILNQFGRRNITNYVRIELMQEYKAVMNEQGNTNSIRNLKQNNTDLSTMDKSVKPEHNTRNIVADKLNLGSGTIARAETVIKKATEEVKEKLRTGDISINQAYKDIKSVEKIELKEQKAKERENIISGIDDNIKNIETEITQGWYKVGKQFLYFGNNTDKEFIDFLPYAN